MANVLLVIQLIISIILTFLILIQKSEGGALGIGGATNSISRLTGILGAAFIINCMILSVVYNNENKAKSLIDEASAEQDERAAKKTNLSDDSHAHEGLTTDSETADKTNPLEGDTVEAPEAMENSEAEVEAPTEPAAEDTSDDE